MADAGLFIGWGAPVRGREAKGLEVFNEALSYYARLQQEGVIESLKQPSSSLTAVISRGSSSCAGARTSSRNCELTMSSDASRRVQL